MMDSMKVMCCLTVIPVRAAYYDSSEIVTQLLFGETATIISIHNQWVKIKIEHDNYEGWVDNKQLLKISEATFDIFKTKLKRQQESVLILNTPWGIQNILKGSPVLSDIKAFVVDSIAFNWVNKVPTESKKDLVELALSYSNSPYLWGGRTTFGIDCSGFTQTVFHQIGMFLPRDASKQYLEGKKVNFDRQQQGDLAFFKSETTGNIHHVGIILPNNQIIHAHGRIRIDNLNCEGIYNEDKKYYSHKLISINNFDS